jgi:hypothetical protein
MSDATKAADDLTASFKAMLGPTEDYTGMANAKLAALGQRPDATDEPLRRVAALMNDTMGTLKQSYAGDTLAQLGLTGTEDQATMQARAANYLLGPRQMGDYNMDAINKQLGDQTSSAAAMDAIIAQIGGQVALGNSAVISTAGGAAANPLGMDGAGLGTGLGTTMGTSAIDTFKGLGWQAAGIFVVGEIAKGAKSSDSGLLEAIAGPLYPYIKKRLHDEGELTY